MCRRLNETAVRAAIESGARSPDCIQAHNGHTFNCGRCRDTMADMLAEKASERCEHTQVWKQAAE